MKILAIALIVLGVIGLIYGGITYTSRDKVVDLGPIQATAEREHTLPLPPIAGAVLVAAGAGILLTQKKR
jgi:hypothetical protein